MYEYILYPVTHTEQTVSTAPATNSVDNKQRITNNYPRKRRIDLIFSFCKGLRQKLNLLGKTFIHLFTAVLPAMLLLLLYYYSCVVGVVVVVVYLLFLYVLLYISCVVIIYTVIVVVSAFLL